MNPVVTPSRSWEAKLGTIIPKAQQPIRELPRTVAALGCRYLDGLIAYRMSLLSTKMAPRLSAPAGPSYGPAPNLRLLLLYPKAR